jgi:hypothetical protein
VSTGLVALCCLLMWLMVNNTTHHRAQPIAARTLVNPSKFMVENVRDCRVALWAVWSGGACVSCCVRGCVWVV